MTLYTGHMIRSWRFMPMLEGLTLSQVNVQVPGITKNQYNHPLQLGVLGFNWHCFIRQLILVVLNV